MQRLQESTAKEKAKQDVKLEHNENETQHKIKAVLQLKKSTERARAELRQKQEKLYVISTLWHSNSCSQHKRQEIEDQIHKERETILQDGGNPYAVTKRKLYVLVTIIGRKTCN